MYLTPLNCLTVFITNDWMGHGILLSWLTPTPVYFNEQYIAVVMNSWLLRWWSCGYRERIPACQLRGTPGHRSRARQLNPPLPDQRKLDSKTRSHWTRVNPGRRNASLLLRVVATVSNKYITQKRHWRMQTIPLHETLKHKFNFGVLLMRVSFKKPTGLFYVKKTACVRLGCDVCVRLDIGHLIAVPENKIS